MLVKHRNIQELAALVHDATEGLSARAVATLVAHPDVLRSALAVAADSLSAKSARDEDGQEAEIGVDPLWWPPDPLGRRCPPCRNRDRRTHRTVVVRAVVVEV